eukprot:jgi/Tetstr1/448387/TSEL_035666.t1
MNPHHSKEQESVKPPASPQLCANNCGFFANPACSNMCSKCYQDSSSRQHVDMAAQAMATSVANKLLGARAAVADTPMDEEEDKRPVQKNPNRCFECNKRVG